MALSRARVRSLDQAESNKSYWLSLSAEIQQQDVQLEPIESDGVCFTIVC